MSVCIYLQNICSYINTKQQITVLFRCRLIFSSLHSQVILKQPILEFPVERNCLCMFWLSRVQSCWGVHVVIRTWTVSEIGNFFQDLFIGALIFVFNASFRSHLPLFVNGNQTDIVMYIHFSGAYGTVLKFMKLIIRPVYTTWNHLQ